MTAELKQACNDLAAWLHPTRELITRPDTQPTIGRTKPGSKPPWNAEPANLLFTITGGLADIEQQFRHDITGKPAHLCRRAVPWTERHVLLTMRTITRLAPAADPCHVDEATRQVNAWVTSAMQLPAVDLEERWRRLPAPCPHCKRRMLMASVRNGHVACLGCTRRGQMHPGRVSEGYVEWDDGTIT